MKKIEYFLKKFPINKIEFINDNLEIPEEGLRKQQKLLNVNTEEFTKGAQKSIQDLKGLKVNYELLFIEKKNLTP